MKYVNSCGTLCVSSKRECKFYDLMTAVMACNVMQMFYVNLGLLTTNTINKENRKVELQVHFDSFALPALPECYLYTSKEITSHSYSGYPFTVGARVRVFIYRFEY